MKFNVTSSKYRASAFYVTFYTQVLKIEPGIIARIFFLTYLMPLRANVQVKLYIKLNFFL